MSQWGNHLSTNHPVWERMRNLGPAIDGAIEREGIDQECVDGWERVRAVLTLVGKRLAGADPLLVQRAALDGIADQLQGAITAASTAASDPNPGLVDAANGHAEAILGHLPALNYPFVADDWNALRDAGISYRETLATASTAYRRTLDDDIAAVEKELTAHRSEIDGAAKQLVALSAEITTERTRLTSLASDFQGQFSTAQDTRGKDFAEAQTSRQTTFGQVVADYTKRLTEQDGEFTKQRETDARLYQERLTALDVQFSSAAKTILSEIEKSKNAVEKLVGVIGNLGVTSGYLKAANQARWTTWFWQGVAVLAMGAVIGVAWIAFVPVLAGTFSWGAFAGRVFVCLTVGALAAYAVAQADRYGVTERQNRRLALELEAIGPYLAPLPTDKKEALLVQLAERTFGQPEASGPGEKSPSSVLDILKSSEIKALITDIIKAARG